MVGDLCGSQSQVVMLWLTLKVLITMLEREKYKSKKKKAITCKYLACSPSTLVAHFLLPQTLKGSLKIDLVKYATFTYRSEG